MMSPSTSRPAGPAGRQIPLIKEILLCLTSAAFLILSFPGFNFEFLAWFAFVPLFFALKNKSKAKAFIFSYITGVLFWLGTIYWLIHVTLLGMILLVLYLALYFGVFGLLFFYTLHVKRYRLLFIPSLWVILEYARSHLLTGFPWALLGYSQFRNLPAIQIADIFGVWGVSFLVMLTNMAIYKAASRQSPVPLPVRQAGSPQSPVPIFHFKYIWPAIICLVLTLCYGFFKLHTTPRAVGGTPIKISVIQGNIPQELKWYPGAREDIINKYMLLSKLAVREKPDLIVWPEAALPVILEEEPSYFEKVRGLAKVTRTSFLLGAVTAKGDLYYNSALLVSKEGEKTIQYDKLHLVPFGEYIPLRNIFPFLQTIVPIGDVNRGKEYKIFSANLAGGPGHSLRSKFSVLICFEDVFPELSRQFVKYGAQFLVNITNDAWYKETFASYQHLQASVFRAVENRVNVLRSANTGVSCFISPEGRIISLVADASGKEIFVDGYKTEEITIDKQTLSLYTHFGDWVVWVCLIFVLGSIIADLLHHGDPGYWGTGD